MNTFEEAKIAHIYKEANQGQLLLDLVSDSVYLIIFLVLSKKDPQKY